MNNFENEKILIPYRAKKNDFAISDKPRYFSTDCYSLTAKDNNDLKFLLGLLNSKVYMTWFKIMGRTKGDIIEFMPTTLESTPIINISDEDKKNIVNYVDKIILEKKYNEYDIKINDIIMKYIENNK